MLKIILCEIFKFLVLLISFLLIGQLVFAASQYNPTAFRIAIGITSLNTVIVMYFNMWDEFCAALKKVLPYVVGSLVILWVSRYISLVFGDQLIETNEAVRAGIKTAYLYSITFFKWSPILISICLFVSTLEGMGKHNKKTEMNV